MMPQTLQTHIGAYLSLPNVLPVMPRLQMLLWCLICILALKSVRYRH